MKKSFLVIITVALLGLLLAACGSSSETSAPAESQGNSQEEAQTSENEATTATEEAEAVHPYAWLGLQDMPECPYLDILATNHYLKVSDTYIAGMSHVTKETNAVDGINTYKEDEYRKVYSIEGKVVSLNESSKSYMEQDASDIAESSKEALTAAMENGTNIRGRSLKGTGSEAVPIYSEQGDDTDEYEYYEYYYPDVEANSDNSTIERFYLKDGDVFAIYTKTTLGETEVESTEVIESISEDIPEGTFDLPDLSDYEKLEF